MKQHLQCIGWDIGYRIQGAGYRMQNDSRFLIED
jgi:hypothetical protein